MVSEGTFVLIMIFYWNVSKCFTLRKILAIMFHLSISSLPWWLRQVFNLIYQRRMSNFMKYDTVFHLWTNDNKLKGLDMSFILYICWRRISLKTLFLTSYWLKNSIRKIYDLSTWILLSTLSFFRVVRNLSYKLEFWSQPKTTTVKQEAIKTNK